MVGLGFAISSQVVSNNNAVEELMIDMSADKAYFVTGDGKDKPSNGVVDGILGLEISNEKKGEDPGIKATGGFAFMKIYGNVTNVTLKANAQIAVGGVVAATLILYDASGTTLDKVATATITTAEASFIVDPGKTIECGKIYAVAITGLDGSTFTRGNDGTITSTTLDGTTNITHVMYTFKATATA